MRIHATPDSQGAARQGSSWSAPSRSARPAREVRLEAPHAPQAKLTIGAPNDRFEREADRIADEVMHASPAGGAAPGAPSGDPPLKTLGPSIQRRCSACDHEDEVRAKPIGAALARPPAARGELEAARGGGVPLPTSARQFFEPRFGCDFGAVRLHADDRAAGRAASLGARAYTIGSDIVFGAGELAPETTAGRTLLAHELAHVVQQRAAPAPTLQRKEGDPPNPGTSIAKRGGDDVLLVGPWEFAIIRASDGAELKRLGGSQGSYQKLATPVGSSHGSVSWTYAVGIDYENPQSTLVVVPGKDRAHVEESVLPAVQIQVAPRGGVAPPKPAVAGPSRADTWREHYRGMVAPALDKLVEDEDAAAAGHPKKPIEIDGAKLAAAYPNHGPTDVINLLNFVHWDSLDQMKQFLDSYAGALRARGDERFALRVDAMRDAVVAEYDAAKIRAGEASARKEEEELQRARDEQRVQDTSQWLGTQRGPIGLTETPLAQFNQLIYPVARPFMIGLVETTDFVSSFVPILGEVKMLGEAWTGKSMSAQYLYMLDHPEAGWDNTPQDLAKWERGLNVALVALPMLAKLRKLGSGEAGRVIRAIANESGKSEKEVSKVLQDLTALEGKEPELKRALEQVQEVERLKAEGKTLDKTVVAAEHGTETVTKTATTVEKTVEAGKTVARPLEAAGAKVERQVVAVEAKLGETLPKPTEKFLAENPEVLEALDKNDRAAEVLKHCSDQCFPLSLNKAQVETLGINLDRLVGTGKYDVVKLRTALFNARNLSPEAIDRVIGQVVAAPSSKTLDQTMDFLLRGEQVVVGETPAARALRQERRGISESLGVINGYAEALKESKTELGFQNPFEHIGGFGQGFDHVMGSAADKELLFIVEYKGNAGLKEGQMEMQWVIDNILRLHNEGGEPGKKWAKLLADALSKGKLQGAIYRTTIEMNVAKGVTKEFRVYPRRNIFLP